MVIRGRRNILSFLNLLIKGAEKRIAVSIWEEEMEDLLPELDRALKRGGGAEGDIFRGKKAL